MNEVDLRRKTDRKMLQEYQRALFASSNDFSVALTQENLSCELCFVKKGDTVGLLNSTVKSSYSSQNHHSNS